ncbi:Frataxin, partial [Meredithblackwellia eburnea MCA 4105]
MPRPTTGILRQFSSSFTFRTASTTLPTGFALRTLTTRTPRHFLPTSACSCLRTFATTRALLNEVKIGQYEVKELDEQTYATVSDRAMERLTEYLEEHIEDLGRDAEGFEVDYSSGVLTLDLGDNGTYVINKQPPNKQIWLSSPLSGPKRYDYDQTHRVWFYHRDGTLLRDLLNNELKVLMSPTIDVDLGEEDDLE